MKLGVAIEIIVLLAVLLFFATNADTILVPLLNLLPLPFLAFSAVLLEALIVACGIATIILIVILLKSGKKISPAQPKNA